MSELKPTTVVTERPLTSAATTRVQGTVSDPPAVFLRLAPGTILRGEVLGQDDHGRYLVRTDQGLLAVTSKATIPIGSEVTLQIRQTSADLLVLIMRIERSGPAHPGPQGTAATPPAAGGQAVGAAAPPASGPAGSGPVPAPPAARQAPAGDVVILGQAIRATLFSVAGDARPAGERPPPAFAALPAGTALTLRILSIGPPAPGGHAPAAVVAGTAQSPRPAGQAAAPAAGGAPSTAPAAAPPAGTAGPTAALVPAGTSAGARGGLEGRPPAAATRQAAPGAPAQPAVPGGQPAQAAWPVWAAAQGRAAPPGEAGAAGKSGAAVPAPTASAKSGAGSPAAAAPVRASAAAPPAQAVPAPPAQTAGAPPAQAGAAPLRQAGEAAAGRPFRFVATVTGTTSSGQPLLSSPLGTLSLEIKTPLAAGAQLTLELGGNGLRSGDLRPLALPWPSLEESYRLLQAHGSPPALAALAAQLPTPGSKLAAGLLWFLSGLSGGAAGGRTAFPLDKTVAEALERAGRRELAGRLSQELVPAGRTIEGLGGEWRGLALPILVGDGFDTLRIFVRRREDDGSRERSGADDEATRFLLEVNFARWGELQLDGLARQRRLDLILRSRSALPDAMRDDIADIFYQSLEAAGLAGRIGFSAGADWHALTAELSRAGDPATVTA